MRIDRTAFLKEIASLLEYHKSIGIGDYPRTEDIDSFCRSEGLLTSVVESARNEASVRISGGAVSPEKKGACGAAEEKGDVIEESLPDISMEVTSCRACDLYRQRIHPVPGLGKAGVRLFVVGDWLSSDAVERGSLGKIMGDEQDKMLFRMLAAIKLAPEQVFITNVIKCALPVSCQPVADHVHSCISFLHRQIAVASPEIICTMGMIAAKAILGRPRSLSQLRGRFHTYETKAGLAVPVITTYHPTYLLQNPEMKKATWADLQLLAQRLDLSR